MPQKGLTLAVSYFSCVEVSIFLRVSEPGPDLQESLFHVAANNTDSEMQNTCPFGAGCNGGRTTDCSTAYEVWSSH